LGIAGRTERFDQGRNCFDGDRPDLPERVGEARSGGSRDRRVCSTQKPIEIVARPILYHTKPGELFSSRFRARAPRSLRPKRKAGGAMAWSCRQRLSTSSWCAGPTRSMPKRHHRRAQPRARSEQAGARKGLDHYNACNARTPRYLAQKRQHPRSRRQPDLPPEGVFPGGWGARHGIEMVSMRQSDHPRLLRLVTAGSAESRCFVLRLPAKGKSNTG